MAAAQLPHYLIIGRGRVARHFAHYFTLLNISYTQWHRDHDLADLSVMAARASHILLLINDDAIEHFVHTHLDGVSAFKIHFSGSLVTDAAYGAHPLMTFGATLYDEGIYQNIAFVVDDDAPGNHLLLPGLPNRIERIAKDKKPLYHALCVLAGNYSCLLWQKFFDGLKDMNLPPEIGRAYLKQQTENLLANYQTALTGPLARGDIATINRNLAALNGDPYRQVYESFVTAYREEKQK